MVGANTIIFGFHFYRIIDAPVRFTVRCIATRKFNTMIYVKFLSLQKETVCLSVSWMLIYAFPCRVTRYWLRILLLSVKSRCNYNHKHYTGVPPELILSTSIPYAPVQWATYLLHSDWSVITRHSDVTQIAITVSVPLHAAPRCTRQTFIETMAAKKLDW